MRFASIELSISNSLNLKCRFVFSLIASSSLSVTIAPKNN